MLVSVGWVRGHRSATTSVGSTLPSHGPVPTPIVDRRRRGVLSPEPASTGRRAPGRPSRPSLLRHLSLGPSHDAPRSWACPELRRPSCPSQNPGQRLRRKGPRLRPHLLNSAGGLQCPALQSVTLPQSQSLCIPPHCHVTAVFSHGDSSRVLLRPVQGQGRGTACEERRMPSLRPPQAARRQGQIAPEGCGSATWWCPDLPGPSRRAGAGVGAAGEEAAVTARSV